MAERVLICDDEPALLQTLSSLFSSNGFQVSLAADGVEGFTLFMNEADTKLCVIDLQMPPGIDGGLFLVTRIRAVTRTIPVVVFSETGTVSRSHEITRAGATAFVEKSAGVDALLQRSLTLLANSPVSDSTLGQAPLAQLANHVDLPWLANGAILGLDARLRTLVSSVHSPTSLAALLTQNAGDAQLANKLAALRSFDRATDRLTLGDWFTLAVFLSRLRSPGYPPTKLLCDWQQKIVPIRNSLAHARHVQSRDLLLALLACHDCLAALA